MFNRSYIIGHEEHPHYLPDSQIGLLSKSVDFSLAEVELIKIIKNLSDPTKFKIYLLLHKVEEIAVADLTNILGLTQSAVSHALSDLKNLGIVEARRCGHLICYSLTLAKEKRRLLSFFERLN